MDQLPVFRSKIVFVRLITAFLAAASLLLVSLSVSAQPATTPATPGDQLLDVLVWGAHMQIDPAAYPAALKAEVDRYLRRSNAYRSARTAPDSLEMQKVHEGEVIYERRLVAVSDDTAAPSLAVAYVDGLRPCYEWEGYHDCPEAEAVFADRYQAAHPRGPFSEYLPLLSAHRWLCAAEAFDYEKRPVDAARSRATYGQRIAVARASSVLLIRTAADRLAARGRCFSPPAFRPPAPAR
jgi:hypothetical protein